MIFRYFGNYSSSDYAKAGSIPSENIILQPGPLDFPVTMLDEVRKLGMVSEVDDGALVLCTPLTIASIGIPLTPEQAKILVKLDKKIIEFKVSIDCIWENGKYTELK